MQLIQKAVRNTKWVSGKAVMDQIFIWLFNHLVYPQIWEDPNPDADALKNWTGITYPDDFFGWMQCPELSLPGTAVHHCG